MIWPIVAAVTDVTGWIVVAATDVAGRIVAAVANVADQIIVAAAKPVIGAMMLLTNVGNGIVTSLAGLSDRGNGDRTHGGDRDQGLGVSRMHWVPPFPGR